jgi:tetratricopeptide (TPR) repeat protein
VRPLRAAVLSFLASLLLVGLAAQQPPPSPSSVGPPPVSVPSIGLALAAQGKLAEALPLLEAECAKSPGEPKLGLARAQCLLDQARWKEALAASQVLLEKFPDDADIRVMVGDALFVSFRPSEAVETWRPLMSDPKEGERALSRMLGALLAQRRFGEAGKLAAEARAAGVVFSGTALSLASQAGACPEKLAFLEELGKRYPEEKALEEEIKVQRGVCLEGGTATSATGTLPAKIGKAKLNGKRSGDIRFDSGSQSTILYAPKWGKALGLTELGQASFAGLGEKGARTASKALLASFEVGNLKISNLPVISGRADETFIKMGFGPFLDYVVELDSRKSRRVLWPAGTPVGTIFGKTPDISLPVLWYRGIPLVPVAINGMGPYPFLFDTGASNTILAAQFCPLLGLRPTLGNYVSTRGTGASGSFPIGYAENVILSIGGREETPPWIQMTEIPQYFSGPVYGFLGRDFIGDYRVVFDGPGCMIHLLRYPSGRYRDPMLNRPPPNLKPDHVDDTPAHIEPPPYVVQSPQSKGGPPD